MSYEPRQISFLGREGRFKHYGIAVNGPAPRPALADAVRAPGPGRRDRLHDRPRRAFAGLGLVYWWAHENEIHRAAYASPLGDPGALEPLRDTGMACVWELEVIDFERRAWLEDVLIGGDEAAYLERALDPVAV